MAGLLTRSLFGAFPFHPPYPPEAEKEDFILLIWTPAIALAKAGNSGYECQKVFGAYSSGNCPGLSPDSLLSCSFNPK